MRRVPVPGCFPAPSRALRPPAPVAATTRATVADTSWRLPAASWLQAAGLPGRSSRR